MEMLLASIVNITVIKQEDNTKQRPKKIGLQPKKSQQKNVQWGTNRTVRNPANLVQINFKQGVSPP